MKSLKSFYNDKETKDNVYNYLIDYLTNDAVNRLFAKEDVSAVAEAKEIIDKAFENLSLLFEPKNSKKEPMNQAR